MAGSAEVGSRDAEEQGKRIRVAHPWDKRKRPDHLGPVPEPCRWCKQFDCNCEVSFPETDPVTYKAWVEEGWLNIVLEELECLLLFVRWQRISGLQVMKIRAACFTPFGGKDMFNRRVWLYMNEIDAYQNAYKEPVNEEALAEEWKLSGIKRP